MRRNLQTTRYHRREAQALVFVALVLTFLSMLVLTCIEVAARYQQLAQIEDALKQATRSSVQAFDYSAFAQNGQKVRETNATISGCASVTTNSARALACTVFLTNAAGVGGMQETPAQTAARIRWTFLPQGGTCAFPNRPSLAFTTPAVCASVQPHMRGLLGWGVWTPQVDAADTLDRSQ
jgi:Flp pilus assembly protein TadG